MEESTKEIVKKAAIAVGSLKETEFDVRFNPDVYSPGVQHYDPDEKQLTKQRQLVKDAADFLLTMQIPGFVSIVLQLLYFFFNPTDIKFLLTCMSCLDLDLLVFSSMSWHVSHCRTWADIGTRKEFLFYLIVDNIL